MMLKDFWNNEDGIGVVEIILILVRIFTPLLWGGYKVYGVIICG